MIKLYPSSLKRLTNIWTSLMIISICAVCILLCGCDESESSSNSQPYLSYQTATITTTSNQLAYNFTPSLQANTYIAAFTPAQYLQQIFSKPYDSQTQLYLPHYAYFQGVAYAQGSVTVIGQMRVLGAVVAASPNSQVVLSHGGMVTSVPEILRDKYLPGSGRFQIVEWQQVE